jgi:hypothetical protein
METIIALLFVLLPIIFKLIGKKLEKSGQLDRAARMRKVAEELGMDPDEGDFAKWFDEAEAEVAREAALEAMREDEDRMPQLVVNPEVKKVEKFVPKGAVPASQKRRQQAQQQAMKEGESQLRPKAKKPILQEEEKKPKEKIDPKKLVVYSEIMKPKYTE